MVLEEQDVDFRHILLNYYLTLVQKKLCAINGNEALTERHCRNRFAIFRSGDFSLKNASRIF